LALKNISGDTSRFLSLLNYIILVVWMINVQMTLYIYFGDTYMTAETKQVVLEEIRAKRGKFSEQDLPSHKDLMTQLAAKYGLEKAQAQRDVHALMEAPPDLKLALPKRSRGRLLGSVSFLHT
jgi:hypothetical protein